MSHQCQRLFPSRHSGVEMGVSGGSLDKYNFFVIYVLQNQMGLILDFRSQFTNVTRQITQLLSANFPHLQTTDRQSPILQHRAASMHQCGLASLRHCIASGSLARVLLHQTPQRDFSTSCMLWLLPQDCLPQTCQRASIQRVNAGTSNRPSGSWVGSRDTPNLL